MPSFWARTDSNSANNPALNLNGDAALEISFIWKSPTSEVGDVVLEQNGGAADPDSLVEINGSEYSFIFEYTGTLPTQNRDGANQVPEHLEGENVYLITVVDYPSAGESTRFAFLPDSNASAVDMDGFGRGAIDIQDLDTSPPATPVCFTKGVLIATPSGDVPVQTLKAGDRVLTHCGRTVTLRWISKSHFSRAQMLFEPNLRPVCIPKDMFGQGLPQTDLWVSPQHRVVLSGWAVELNLGTADVFVRAKHVAPQLTEPDPRWQDGVDYYHLLFDEHEIVLSNGLASESFFPGDEAKKSVSPDNLDELEQALGDLDSTEFESPLATATSYEACVLVDYFAESPFELAA